MCFLNVEYCALKEELTLTFLKSVPIRKLIKKSYRQNHIIPL